LLDLWEEGDEFEEFEFTDFVLEANWFIKLRLLERQFAEKVQGLAKKAEKSALREFLNNVIKVKEAKISAADLRALSEAVDRAAVAGADKDDEGGVGASGKLSAENPERNEPERLAVKKETGEPN